MEWFPRMQAISLALRDAEKNEQNEMRELQKQIVDAHQQIKNLSEHLDEMKQVNFSRGQFLRVRVPSDAVHTKMCV